MSETDEIMLQDTIEKKIHVGNLGATTWVVTLELYHLPNWGARFNVCKASLVVKGTGDGGGGDEEMLRSIVRVDQKSDDTPWHSSSEGPVDEATKPQDESRVDRPSSGGDEADIDSSLATAIQDVDSNNASSSPDVAASSVEDDEVTEDMPEAETPALPRSRPQGDFLCDLVKLPGLSSWNSDLVTVLVGEDKIKFVVSAFVLTNNFGFFRATLEDDPWAESQDHVITIPEESPVDFVLLLRFIVHNQTKNFNDVVNPCYPFGPQSHPYDLRRLYEYDTSLAPWLFRMVAMAERLCFSFPSSRLTEMLEKSLELRPTDRVSPPLLDWVLKHTIDGSVLRDFVYERVLVSVINGDVRPDVYSPFLEEDATLSGLASFVLRGYQNKILANSGADRKVEHVWEEGLGWTGCTGVCLTCWSRDLGGLPEELAKVLLD